MKSLEFTVFLRGLEAPSSETTLLALVSITLPYVFVEAIYGIWA